MIRTAVPIAVLVLASACDDARTTDADAQAENTASVPAPAATTPPAATTRRQIGTVSGLAADTGPLSGQVSDFLVERTDTATIVSLAADTLFAFDSADLNPGVEAGLAQTATLVREGGGGAVEIIGHTDAKGELAYNESLSRRRAAAVAAWLRAQAGLGQRTYDITGAGEGTPKVPNTRPDGSDDPAGRARNRRVEVVIPR